MPLSRLDRLEELLAPADGQAGRDAGATEAAAFTATFGFDRQGFVVIDLEVTARLPLVCQKSLEVFCMPVERRSQLVVIEAVTDQETVPDHYEPFLVENRRLAMADLVEEELLLAVPQVPRRPDAGEGKTELPADVDIATSGGDEDEPTHRPFADLAGLMKKATDA